MVDVFGLQLPTPEVPFVQQLLDPCSNSKAAPNIPAEKLYDIKVIDAGCHHCLCRVSTPAIHRPAHYVQARAGGMLVLQQPMRLLVDIPPIPSCSR